MSHPPSTTTTRTIKKYEVSKKPILGCNLEVKILSLGDIKPKDIKLGHYGNHMKRFPARVIKYLCLKEQGVRFQNLEVNLGTDISGFSDQEGIISKSS